MFPNTHTKTFKLNDTDEKLKIVWWKTGTDERKIKEEWTEFRRRNVGWSRLSSELEGLHPEGVIVQCWFTGDTPPTLNQIKKAVKIFFA